MRTTMITRPGAAAPSQYGSKLSPMLEVGVARAKTAGVPPLTYLAEMRIADDRLILWRDTLQSMPRADTATIAYWTHAYLGQWPFNKTENREGFTVDAVRFAQNRECREIEIIEAYERLRINRKVTRDAYGQTTVEKLRDNPEWHPSFDQIYDAVAAAQRKFRSILRQLTQRCEEAKERAERAAGLRQTLGQEQAINAVGDAIRQAARHAIRNRKAADRLSDAERHAIEATAQEIHAADHEIEWQAYVADRPARREALVAIFRRERDAKAVEVGDAEYAVRYYTGRPFAEAEARRRLARKQAEYDLAEAALKNSEADLALALVERRQRLAAPVKRLGRPQ